MKARWCVGKDWSRKSKGVGVWQEIKFVEKADSFFMFYTKIDSNPIAWERAPKIYLPYFDLLDDELEQEVKLLEMR